MTINKAFQIDNPRSPSCKEAGYSFDYQSRQPDFVHDSANEQELIEPFDSEEEALDFVNHYSQMVINETR